MLASFSKEGRVSRVLSIGFIIFLNRHIAKASSTERVDMKPGSTVPTIDLILGDKSLWSSRPSCIMIDLTGQYSIRGDFWQCGT